MAQSVSVSSPVQVGDLLATKYRVERVLGVGGMGVVVAARHEQLGQLVAIKYVREDALDQSDAVERFLREARAAVKLRSEHVARVLDVGTLASGAPYMVMEYLDGSDLGQILNDSGAMAVDRAVLLVLQACEAVAEAHEAGIVHRDLKPQNLFLTRTVGGSPCLKVLDFGVSKSVGLMSDGHGALTRTRHILGSPLYMAPEQMRSSRDVDARVDVWALGVVLFELLTRRWPFEAESLPELCLKVVTEPPQSLSLFRPDVPPGLVAVVEHCLEKDPAKRLRNASEVAKALEPFAPPLMARVAAERPRASIPLSTTNPGGPTEGASAHPGRSSTLPSASAPVGTVEGTPAAWGSSRTRGPTPPSGPEVSDVVMRSAATTLPAPRPRHRVGIAILVASVAAACGVWGVLRHSALRASSETATQSGGSEHGAERTRRDAIDAVPSKGSLTSAAGLAVPPEGPSSMMPVVVALPAMGASASSTAAVASEPAGPSAGRSSAGAMGPGTSAVQAASPSPARPQVQTLPRSPAPFPPNRAPSVPKGSPQYDDIPSLR